MVFSENKLFAVASQFALEGKVAEIRPFGSGHIHDTFRMYNGPGPFPDYILQKINHQVFKKVPELTRNLELVTNHLRQKLTAIPHADPGKEVLTLVPTHEGESFYLDERENYWRVFLFLSDTYSYDLVETAGQAFAGGKGFGRFLALMADFPAGKLTETIPDFHNVENRYLLFREAIDRDLANRVREVGPEIAYVEQQMPFMSSIRRLGREGLLPLRITHNDTKFNNVLLNQEGEAQCVIDLDTVMPGYAAYDFGDAIRTVVSSVPEDEGDMGKIKVSMDLFEGFTKGFLEETRDFLDPEELKSLETGVYLLPFIMGLRFLTDYIGGDTYYKITYPNQNLLRCRTQFELVRKLMARSKEIKAIIQEFSQLD